MRKMQILGVFIAVLMFSALAVAGASATLWLKAGESVTKNEKAASHGTIILVHEGRSLGAAKVECSGLVEGTVGAGGAGSVTLAENLAVLKRT